MAYCTITDVQALNPKRTYSTTTTPTTTQVTALIDRIASEIDAVLAAKGYTIPVTTPTTFVTFLKTVNAYGAGALAEAAMFPETSEAGSTPHWKMLQTKYDAWMKLLIDGGAIPASMAADAEGESVGGAYLDGDNKGDAYPEPIFRISANDKDF
ncbi:hypothetical protein M0R72_13140 [Candidatus Pacearchaeota archaeon]|jgi:hypothetical protein|nr:hypothetical protein [Candidatus Pacearchaeota archaeon]